MKWSGNSYGYTTICQHAAETHMFYSFKAHSEYKRVLEHVTKEHGEEYYNLLSSGVKLFLNVVGYANDLIGSPDMYDYPFGRFSPTTLRYAKVLSDILKITELKALNVCEIGAGYGGQAFMLNKWTELNYTIYDMPVCLPLIERYLKAHNETADLYSCEDVQPREYDLLISNYAFSELNRESQKIYIDNIINNCETGYMTCNFITPDSYSLEELLDLIKHNIEVQEEIPLTHPKNKILIWK